MTKPLTQLDNTAEATTQSAEVKLPEYIIALQGYFRKQEDDFTTYYVKSAKRLLRVKPVNPDGLTGDKKPVNKPLQDFVDGYDWQKYNDDLLTIIKYIQQTTVPTGIENARMLINQVAKLSGKPKKKSWFKRLFKYDIHDAVIYANSPKFAVDAQVYINSNYDEFLTGAKQISKNIDSYTSELIYKELYTGIEKLESIPNLAKRVGTVFDGCSQNRATMIARTETMRAFNTATIDSYQVAKVNEAQILVANDERTCDICMPLNGLVLPLDEARSTLPMHVMCRCTWLAVIGKPMLKEPELSTVQDVISKNPKIPIANYFKVPKIPKVPVFTPAKTVKEAEKWAIKNLDFKKVNYEGVHLDYANRVNKEIARLKKIYPTDLKGINFEDRMMLIAQVNHKTNMMNVRVNYFSSKKEYIKFAKDYYDGYYGFKTKKTLESLISHEYYHSISFKNLSPQAKKQFTTKTKALYKDYKKDGQWTDRISTYAGEKDYEEFAAEAFSSFFHSDAKSQYADDFMEILNDTFNIGG